MAAAYLYLNAILYAVFAAWCTVSAPSTARSIGYLQLSAAGRVEYSVVYGGLQLGLAVVFLYLATHSQLWRLGLSFSLALYIPIVLYRVIGIGIFWPVSSVGLAVAAMEVGLLLVAAFLFYSAQ